LRVSIRVSGTVGLIGGTDCVRDNGDLTGIMLEKMGIQRTRSGIIGTWRKLDILGKKSTDLGVSWRWPSGEILPTCGRLGQIEWYSLTSQLAEHPRDMIETVNDHTSRSEGSAPAASCTSAMERAIMGRFGLKGG
jgi:hypothetical protein